MDFKFSSFSVLTVFICLSIIGASLIPQLSIQLTPSKELPSININYRWQDASAKVMEQEVTSKLEGVFNTVKGIKSLNSRSDKGWENIAIEFKKNSNMDALRFELANLIRQTYSELPDRVSYPNLSLSAANENKSPILSYSINANKSPYFIKKYTENHILSKLSSTKGVNQVNVYGAVPFEWIIEYNSDMLQQLNISVDNIQTAVNTHLNEKELGNGVFKVKNEAYDHEIVLNLSYEPNIDIDWNKIPIKNTGSRIVYLGNIATVSYKEADVTSYYKIIPVVQTIISTIFGLIPFVWNGQNEAFWFSFAAGSIGGLVFSFIGIFFYLPLFILKKTLKL